MADNLGISSFLTFILEGSQKKVDVKCLNRSPWATAAGREFNKVMQDMRGTSFFFFRFYFIFYFTTLYWFCHTSTWIFHGCTRVPNPETPSHLLPHTIPLGHPSAPAPSILYPALNLDWQFVSYKINYTCFSLLMRWVKLKPIIQSEGSQKEKHQYSILMHIYGI